MDLKKQKQEEIYNELGLILEELNEACTTNKRLDQVELQIFHRLLQMGMKLLLYYITLVSNTQDFSEKIVDRAGEKMKNKGKKNKPYRSVFGQMQIQRTKYYSKVDKVYYPLDEALSLPLGSYSYLLQDWLSYGASDASFAESVGLLRRVLNQELDPTQSRRCTLNLSQQVECYYSKKDWLDQEGEGTHLCIGADGKGVPILNIDREDEPSSPGARLGKGKRGGIKKEATVTVSSSFTPKPRTAHQIMNNLFKKEPISTKAPASTDNRLHCNKHLRAYISNKTKALEYGVEQLKQRDVSNKPIVAVMDGEPVLRKQIQAIIKQKGMQDRLECCILDFIHVLEKVWKVANAYKGEKAKDRQEWVEQQACLLLNSETQKVIDYWKLIKEQGTYSKTQSKHIDDGIKYFEKRLPMMDYKTFLAKGYPITTGVIESACGHFVKNRMERNGMRWTFKGAQDMLDIRAIKKNDHWDDYMKYYIDLQQMQRVKTAA